MSRSRLVGALAALGCLAGSLTASAPPASAVPPSAGAGAVAHSLLPAHVFAPYVETYSGSNLATLSRRSGAGYLNPGVPADAGQRLVHRRLERHPKHTGRLVHVRAGHRPDPGGGR